MAVPTESAQRFEVVVGREARYDVHVRPAVLAEIGRMHRACFPDAKPFVLADAEVLRLHGEALAAAFSAEGLAPEVVPIPAGEASKSLSFERLIRRRRGAPTAEPCSTARRRHGRQPRRLRRVGYMRGVRYANVPTSLIGWLDAAIGGRSRSPPAG
jgi:3-dehydroquinate synthase